MGIKIILRPKAAARYTAPSVQPKRLVCTKLKLKLRPETKEEIRQGEQLKRERFERIKARDYICCTPLLQTDLDFDEAEIFPIVNLGPKKPIPGTDRSINVLTMNVLEDLDRSIRIQEVQAKENHYDGSWKDSGFEEYAEEINQYLFEQEVWTLPSSNYMDKQPFITREQRQEAVEWIYEVHKKYSGHIRYSISQETLHLTMNLFDRVLSKKAMRPEYLKTMIGACFMLANKFQDSRFKSSKKKSKKTNLRAKKLSSLSEEVEQKDLLEYEQNVLSALGFDLGYVNPVDFLEKISNAERVERKTFVTSLYFLNRMVLKEDFIGKKPSQCAAASMLLSKISNGRMGWSKKLAEVSGYRAEELRDTAVMLLNALKEGDIKFLVSEEFEDEAREKGVEVMDLAKSYL